MVIRCSVGKRCTPFVALSTFAVAPFGLCRFSLWSPYLVRLSPPRVLGCTSSKFPLNFSVQPIHRVGDTPDRRGVVPRGPIEGALHPPRCWGCLASSGKRGTHSPLQPLCTFSVGFPVRSGTPCAVGIATKKA